MIIDAHSHWLPKEIIENAHFFSKTWSDVEAQVEEMKASGIDKAIISYPSSDAHIKLGGHTQVARIYNNNVAEIIKQYPDKFIAAALLAPEDTQAMLDELKRSREELGFLAISLASSYDGTYLDDDRFLPLYKKAQEEKIPIFVHSQIINPIGYERVKDPLLTPVIEYVFDTTICIGKLLMKGILAEFSDVKFIFAYFGGVVTHLAHRFDATYQMLRGINFVKDLGSMPTEQLKDIYVDTSGDIKMENFLSSLELLGPGHLLWGSDWPAKKDPKASIEVIKNLDLSEKDKENILGGNLANILGGI